MVLELFFIVEVIAADGFSKLFIGNGIPDGKGEVGGGGVFVGLAFFVSIKGRVKKVGRGEGEHERALGGGLVVVSGRCEYLVDIGLALGGREGAVEGTGGEVIAEFLELFATVRLVGFGAGEFVDVIKNESRGFDGGVGHGSIPSFRNGGAALVSEGGVIGWEGGGDDGCFACSVGVEDLGGKGFPNSVGAFPLDAEGGFFFFKAKELDEEGDTVAAEEEGRGFDRAHFVSRGDPGVDEGVLLVVGFVEIHAHAIWRGHAEMVGAGFGRKERAGPEGGVGTGINAFDAVIAFDVESRDGVESLKQLSFTVIHFLLVEIMAAEAVLLALPRSVAEGLHDIGDGATVLVLSEAEEVFADRPDF